MGTPTKEENVFRALAQAGLLYMVVRGGRPAMAVAPSHLPQWLVTALGSDEGSAVISSVIEDMARRGQFKIVEDSRPDGGCEFRYAPC